MIKYTSLHSSNMFLRLDRVCDLLVTLEKIKSSEIVSFNTPFDPFRFFRELHEYNNQHFYKRKTTLNIDAVLINLLLPEGINYDEIKTIAYMFNKRELHGLPYISFITKKGKGRYLNFLISEREYMSSPIEHVRLAPCDQYKRLDTEKNKVYICEKGAAGAYLVEKKGTIRKRWLSHFTNKRRYWCGNKEVLIGLTNLMKSSVLNMLRSLNFAVHKAFFKKIDKRKAYNNMYVLNNIKDINVFLCSIDEKLDRLEQIYINLKIYDEDHKRQLHRFRTRIINWLQNYRFAYDGTHSLSFYYKLPRRTFIENMNVLKKITEMDYIDLYKNTI